MTDWLGNTASPVWCFFSIPPRYTGSLTAGVRTCCGHPAHVSLSNSTTTFCTLLIWSGAVVFCIVYQQLARCTSFYQFLCMMALELATQFACTWCTSDSLSIVTLIMIHYSGSCVAVVVPAAYNVWQRVLRNKITSWIGARLSLYGLSPSVSFSL